MRFWRALNASQRIVALFVVITLLALTPYACRILRLSWLAQGALAANRPGEAAQDLASLAKVMPWRKELWEKAGDLAAQAGDFQEAIRYLETARGLNSLGDDGFLILADSYRQAGNLSAAAQSIQAIIEKFGLTADLGQRLLEIHLAQEDYSKATSDLRFLIGLQPSNAQWQYQLGLILASQSPAQAIAPLEQAANLSVDLRPSAHALRESIQTALDKGNDAYLLVTSGRSLAALDEWGLAREAFRRATQERPDYAEAWAYLGEALQHRENQGHATLTKIASEESRQVLEKALALEPDSLAANTLMAIYWERQEYYGPALGYLQKAIALDPDNPPLLAQLGDVQATLGNLPAALQAYQKAVALAPDERRYRVFLVNFCINHSYQLDEIALPAIIELLKDRPDDPEALDLTGQLFIAIGEPVAARRFLEHAIQHDSKFAPAYLHLGILAMQEKKLSEAVRNLLYASDLAPGTPIAGQARRLLENYLP